MAHIPPPAACYVYWTYLAFYQRYYTSISFLSSRGYPIGCVNYLWQASRSVSSLRSLAIFSSIASSSHSPKHFFERSASTRALWRASGFINTLRGFLIIFSFIRLTIALQYKHSTNIIFVKHESLPIQKYLWLLIWSFRLVRRQQKWDTLRVKVNGHFRACPGSEKAVKYRLKKGASLDSRDFKQSLAGWRQDRRDKEVHPGH